ncbi:hypothetical protein DAPPUDRAFT_119385 [Daphnia pulex]|uniref:Uncharacterized protein n=1 Tax=Daphnia pulex TaxID=6669 RepID=E9HYD3_DAPPU|nr:hypothetical protein DAPPUDRAFT_119385 [Daphnia pulex]|eukprot:EFX63245.1 hypothetical protein DAPPUDRAFT_119385 [Daphnia pulex]
MAPEIIDEAPLVIEDQTQQLKKISRTTQWRKRAKELRGEAAQVKKPRKEYFCNKCNQPMTSDGHTQFKGKRFCSATEGKSKEQCSSSNLPQCKKDKAKFTSSTFSSASTDHVQNSRLLSSSFTSPASSSSHSYDSPSYNSDPLLNGLRPLLLDKESTSQEFESPSTGNAVTKLMESPHRKTDFSQRLPLGWRETIDPKDWQWIGQHLFASKGVLA